MPCVIRTSRTLSASSTGGSEESRYHLDNVSLHLLAVFLHIGFSLSRSSHDFSSPHFAKDVTSSDRLIGQPDSSKKKGPCFSKSSEKNSQDSLFEQTRLHGFPLNQLLWPRERNTLIGQAQATCSSPLEPGDRANPTQV